MSRVLVDVDGVLRDLIGGFCRHLNTRAGATRTVRPEDFRDYQLSATLDAEEILEFKRWTALGGYHALRWYRGARELLFWLRGHADVVVLTAAYEDREATREFLRGYVEDRNVLFALPQHKAMHRGAALLEDRAETLLDWAEANPTGIGILIDRPWNRGATEHPRVLRAHNFAHARELLKTRLFLKESA